MIIDNSFTAMGTVIRDLPPTPNNPRNSEGAFLQLENGEIIFLYSRFRGGNPHDDATSDIYMLRSQDNGLSFSGEPTLVLACEGEDGVNVMSVSLLTMANGDIGLFYLVKTTSALVRLFLRRSSNLGKTWGNRVLCTPQQGCFIVNNDRVVRLSNGDILVPAAVHRRGFSVSETETSPPFMDPRGDAVYFRSTDDGVTWHLTPGKCSLSYTAHCTSGLQEPGLLEIKPGLLWSWTRTELGRQYEMFSHDDGDTWTASQPSWFTSPCSPLSMKRMPDGRILAIWNPIPEYNGRTLDWGIWSGGRTPFVCAVSSDNGKSFSTPQIIEAEDKHGYCYTAILFTTDAILLGYCAGGVEDNSILTKIRIRRINYTDLI